MTIKRSKKTARQAWNEAKKYKRMREIAYESARNLKIPVALQVWIANMIEDAIKKYENERKEVSP